MARSPEYKVYDRDGAYQAATHEPEAAACLARFYGRGATIRIEHRFIAWTEGIESQPAAESYDLAAALILKRKVMMIERRAHRAPKPRKG